MHSTRALNSVIFQFVKLSKSIFHGLYEKPNDQLEWCNISHLMCHLRQGLACSMCGQLLIRPYTPLKENCHCICLACRNGGNQPRYNCSTCRDAFQVGPENSFEENINLKYTSSCFVKLCKLIFEKNMLEKWAHLHVDTQNGVVSFGELVREGYDLANSTDNQHLGDRFRKKYKEKEHHCRCGSGAKRSEGKAPGNLTCLGQRCACYKEGKLIELLKVIDRVPNSISFINLNPILISDEHRKSMYQLQVCGLQESQPWKHLINFFVSFPLKVNISWRRLD